MKKSFSSLTFAGGALFGIVLTLCLAAAQNQKSAPTNQPAASPAPAPTVESGLARLKFFAYPNGGTGIFDPYTGVIYVYDSDLNRCYLTKRLQTLGEPMQRW